MNLATFATILKTARFAFLLGTAVLVPLTLTACANSKDKSGQDHEGHEKPKGDGHEGHQH